MTERPTARLGDYLDLLTGFPFKSGNYASDGLGVRLLRGDNIGQGVLRWDGVKLLPRDLATQKPLYELTEGDVVLAMDRPWIEAGIKHAAVGRSDLPCLLVQRVARLRALSGLDQTFLRYVIASRPFTDYVLGVQTGTAVPHISGKQIGEFRFKLPSLAEQRAIADVLGALDDKIEANRQSVASSQVLADTLFAAWRHDLDGQDTTTFGQVADVYGGSTPKTGVAEYWNGAHAWAVPRDVTALGAPYLFDTERHITNAGLSSIGNRLHPPGSIFMTSRATIGVFAVPQLHCAVNQGFIVVVPKDAVFRWFLLHEMRSRVWEMLDLANGSTFLEISRGNFKGIATVLPGRADLESLDRLLAPLHGWCASTVQESARLAELRDVLLPRLLSGELRVRDAEALVEGAV